MPIRGAYVVFTLDPVATLEALEDPVATEQAENLRARKYIGCVARTIDLPTPLRRYNKCTIIFLSQGMPRPSEEEGLEETMCVPINPAQHPTGRADITISPPLPWDNLYHHTLEAVELRLRLKPNSGDDSTSPLLSHEDLLHLNVPFHRDSIRSGHLEHIYNSAHSSSPTASPETVPEDAASLPEEDAPVRPAASCEDELTAPTTFPDERPVSIVSSRRSKSDLPEIATPIATPYEDGIAAASDHSAIERCSESSSVDFTGDSDDDLDDGESHSEDSLAMAMYQMMFFEDPEDRFVPVVKFTLDISTTTELSGQERLREKIADIERLVHLLALRASAFSSGAVRRIQLESEERSRAAMDLLEQQRLEQQRLEQQRVEQWTEEHGTGHSPPMLYCSLKVVDTSPS
ncbi:hypothetical protein BV25DRAFT_1914325 [Artomyces pyxidatus]|uniref:Uncharacterized protein n=1 Tax=Artomyces pyxidatus TaxID=48021 RepID=A0ACB8T875_9AGAM|nr:hypothetical protein BV25DRAFT_1914325 [Artomyces pyxidatus]